MKIYEEKEEKKSWSIKLEEENDEVSIDAVDSETGKSICSLIFFSLNGKITLIEGVKTILKEDGYDPYEHKNVFDQNGKIHII